MQEIKELAHHVAPAGRPQPMTFHDGLLWIGCWETSEIFAVDPASWTVREKIAAPGTPYGIAALGGALHVVVSIGEADDRHIARLVPGKGFDGTMIACPDFTGSHLTTDGTSLYLVQQGNHRILQLGNDAAIENTIALPTRCAGIGFDASGACSIITADDQFDYLNFASFDLHAASPTAHTLAPMNVEARGLAFDGHAWWTAYREINEVVKFELALEGAVVETRG
jgi:hypothetical protein